MDHPLAALFDPAARPNPYPVFRAMREAGPTYFPEEEMALVGSYRDCSRLLQDPTMSAQLSLEPPPADAPPPSFLFLDPPDHTRLRRLVSKAFTPRAVAGLAGRITDLVDEVLDTAVERGGLDVAEDLAAPLPIVIISEWLGVPTQDGQLLRKWSEVITRSLDPIGFADAETILASNQADADMYEYFIELIAHRARGEGTDLLSELLRAEEAGDKLTIPELISTIRLLLIAGHETTTSLISNGILELLRHPAELDRLRADPGLAGRAVEESLRLDPPVQMASRVATQDTEIGSLMLPRGTWIGILLAAANRDPEQHQDPDVFSLERKDTTHLAFSAGVHYCVGAGLARLEASIVFRRFAARVVDPKLDEDSITYRPHVNLRGPNRLSVLFSSLNPAV